MSTTKSKPYRFGGVRVWSDKDRAYTSIDLDVVIDWDKVARILAKKTLHNTSGKSKLWAGAITAKLVKPKAKA